MGEYTCPDCSGPVTGLSHQTIGSQGAELWRHRCYNPDCRVLEFEVVKE